MKLLSFIILLCVYVFLGFLWVVCDWWLLARDRLYLYQEAMLQYKLFVKEHIQTTGRPPTFLGNDLTQTEFCRGYYAERGMEFADEYPPKIANYQRRIILVWVFWPVSLLLRVFKFSGYKAAFGDFLQGIANKVFSKTK